MPKPYRIIPELTEQEIQFFWSKVNKEPGQGPKGRCWEWTGYRMKAGYGALYVGPPGTAERPRVPYLAHRVAYEIQFGVGPPSHRLHECDNPPCVRGTHLTPGDDAKNMHDASVRGRIRSGRNHSARTKPHLLSRGERHGIAAMTDALVLDMRVRCAAGVSQGQLVRETGMSRQAVCDAVNHITWTHVGGPYPPKRPNCGGRPCEVSESTKEKVRQAYADGHSLAQVAKAHGLQTRRAWMIVHSIEL